MMNKLLLTLGFVFSVCSAAHAQVDFNDPKFAQWGDDAASREKNLYSSTFLKEALDNKQYDEATKHLNDLINNAPAATANTYARGAILYKNKVNRAKSLKERQGYVDSILLMHDLRLKYFGDDADQGRAYILDLKARDYAVYNKKDRDGLRATFREALEAAGDNAEVDLAYIYFQNVCQDYQTDHVMADEVLSVYEKLTPFMEAKADEQTLTNYNTLFGTSGAASCENLEFLFSKKLAAAPEDVALLKQAVKLMQRASCSSPFYLTTCETLYNLEPSANAAMGLAAGFQNAGDYVKASKYLNDALASEQDVETREALNSRIALVELAAGNMSAAASAARASIATEDDTQSDNGVALFVLAQAYGASAGSCGGFAGQAAYWAAYDAMNKAIANFSADEQNYLEPAQKMAGSYRAMFPSKEECFFNEAEAGSSYRVSCGFASGVVTTVRPR